MEKVMKAVQGGQSLAKSLDDVLEKESLAREAKFEADQSKRELIRAILEDGSIDPAQVLAVKVSTLRRVLHRR